MSATEHRAARAASGKRSLARTRGISGFHNRALVAGRWADRGHERADAARHQRSPQRAERAPAELAARAPDAARAAVAHPALDRSPRLLVAVARRLRECVRGTDTAARFGGDEFAILLDTTPQGTPPAAVADRVLLALQEPLDVGGKQVVLSASIGIATTSGDADDDIMRNADLAMYKAKSAGKGRYEEFEPALHAAVVARLELELDLRHALERRELVLHFQPIVEISSGAIVGIEALLRWRHPERGLVTPDAFVAVAEETGLMVPIGGWVLREACHQTAELNAARPREHATPLTLCVNLSGEQLLAPGIVDGISEAMSVTKLDPRQLVVEITETVLMRDFAATIAKLHELRTLGVRLEIDDFGTGYSSLPYLKQLPVDILKIAKSFVDELGGSAAEAALPRAIAELAASFGLQVIAEGVELDHQPQRLLRLGCRLAQGFHYSPPLSFEAVSELLAAPSATAPWPDRGPASLHTAAIT